MQIWDSYQAFYREGKMNKEILIILILITLILSVVIGIQFYTTMNSGKELFNKAPELQGIAGYINTEAVKLEELRGKVVLIDFWTYTCINCIRTLPYLNAWHEKYSDDGLIIIGVHTPEFEFEKDYDNVFAAVEKYGIKYSVVQDNDYKTWNAYQNKFWPRKYLVDINGNIRYDHIGEGAYEETEKVIQELLEERADRLNSKMDKENITKPEIAVDVDFTKIKSPELYLGYKFARVDIGNPEGMQPGQTVEYKLPENISPNVVYLEGGWKNNADSMELVSDNGKVVLFYSAKDVNIVAGGNSLLGIFLDDQTVGEARGNDVINDKVLVRENRLYNIVSDQGYKSRLVEIDVEGKGFQIYTFTFG